MTKLRRKDLKAKTKDDLADMILRMLDDTQRIDWLQENIDEIFVTRDLAAGVTFRLTYCSKESGCQVEAVGSELRKLLTDAMRPKAQLAPARWEE